MAGHPVKVGDTVSVPGDMYGTVKFVGSVANKTGTFAGVQLAREFADRGKNSGDVEGRYYFKTTTPGAGIFLPVDRAVKRPPTLAGGNSNAGGGGGGRPSLASPGTPTTSNRLASFNVGGRTPGTGVGKPNFSQSVTAAGRASPALKPPMRRESLPRPQSPLRKPAMTPGKGLATPRSRPPATNLAKSQLGGPGGYRSAGPKPSLGGANKFSQSLRAASNVSNVSTVQSTEGERLGPESSFDEVPEEEAESTPTPTPGKKKQTIFPQQVPQAEVERLKALLDEKDRALRDQSSSIADMERNLNELQKLVPELSEPPSAPRSRSRSRLRQDLEDEADTDLPRDVAALRAALREKNEKIKLLTVEFDANRADFRSTIDTLEMASTETERVYEKRVDELLDEVRNLQDRSEDVESVAQQLKQLEELVAELEEGLEDARRGEAEARGEVEFLRGEVERSRSELRRERERKRTEEQLNGYSSGDSGGNGLDQERLEEMQSHLDSKEDEIRGLKTIIRNLQTDTTSTTTSSDTKPNGITNRSLSHLRNDSADLSHDASGNRISMQQQIRDLEALLQQKSQHEEELVNEVSKLRNSVHLNHFPLQGHTAFGLRSGGGGGGGSSSRPTSRDQQQQHFTSPEKAKHTSTGTQGSQRTVVLSPSGTERETWHDAAGNGKPSKTIPSNPSSPTRTRKRADSQTAHSESSSSAALWCEICEESGHDILSCGNMMEPPPTSPSRAAKPSSTGNAAGGGIDADKTPILGSSSGGGTAHNRNKQSESMPAPLMSRKGGAGAGAAGGAAKTRTPSAPPEEDLPLPPLPTAKDVSTVAAQSHFLSRRADADADDAAAAGRDNNEDEDDEDDTEDFATPDVVGQHTPSTPAVDDGIAVEKEGGKEGKRELKYPIEGTGAQAGMWAGKTSGVIDPEKWCALCERDGHESVDCPVEDAF